MNTSLPQTTTHWNPPSDEAVDRHLDAHRAVPPSPWVRRAPLMVLGGVILAAVMLGGSAAWALPWAGFIGLVVYGSRRVRALRRLERRVVRAHELALLRHHRLALRSVWRLIPDLVQHPALHHRAVVVLAQTLSNVGAFDATIVVYDHLLGDLPDGHPGAVHLKVHRAIAALHTDRLSDADEALRRLRGPMESFEGTPTDAAYRFALLFQSVCTAHYAEAIEESDGLLDTLRPMGAEAGYGHALLAWCYQQRNDHDHDDAGQAKRWWQRATTLLPTAALTARFPQIRGMDDA